jgi:serine/threonine protein kinase
VPVTIGSKLDIYEVVASIGAGGMGEVYRARDTRLKREVAVKVLPEEFARNVDHVSRFQREAELLASLNHPNLAAVYSVGDYQGQPFLVMELLEGQTLKDKMESRRLTVSEVLDIGIQVADALDAAHSRAVVHRDIKPANIFLTKGGRAKVLDFGIAKLMTEVQVGEGRTVGGDDMLTRPGVTIGTVSYMSPEQISGENLDGRTDLFSCGLVLYEMTAGQQAFTGNTSGIIVDAILNRVPVSLTQLSPASPPELHRIIAKLIEKDRRLRCQTPASCVLICGA